MTAMVIVYIVLHNEILFERLKQWAIVLIEQMHQLKGELIRIVEREGYGKLAYYFSI